MAGTHYVCPYCHSPVPREAFEVVLAVNVECLVCPRCDELIPLRAVKGLEADAGLAKCSNGESIQRPESLVQL